MYIVKQRVSLYIMKQEKLLPFLPLSEFFDWVDVWLLLTIEKCMKFDFNRLLRLFGNYWIRPNRIDSYRIDPVAAVDDKNPAAWDALFLVVRLVPQRSRVLGYDGNC